MDGRINPIIVKGIVAHHLKSLGIEAERGKGREEGRIKLRS